MKPKKFKVTLTFLYDSEEDISDWNTNINFNRVTTKEKARQLAISELENNSPNEFEFDVEEFNE